MKKFLIIIPLIFLAGCEFRYRYECQDPQNWGKEWCSNDVCKAEGDCASDVLGFTPKISEQFKNGTDDSDLPVMSRKNFAPNATQAISNKTGVDCKNTEKPKFKPFNSTVQQNTFINSTNQTASAPTQETFTFDYQLEREPFTGVAYEYCIMMATTGTNQDVYASIEWQEIT